MIDPNSTLRSALLKVGDIAPLGGDEGAQGGNGGHLGALGASRASKCRKPGFSILIHYKVMIIISCLISKCNYIHMINKMFRKSNITPGSVFLTHFFSKDSKSSLKNFLSRHILTLLTDLFPKVLNFGYLRLYETYIPFNICLIFIIDF